MPTKRLACLLTCLLLVLTLPACGGKGAASEPEGPNEPAVSVLAPQPEPEPEPVLPYTNPLTGEGCEVDVGARRPIAVMLNNLKKALPQVGVSQADVIYEILAEGGITRMRAVFQDVAGAGEIGTVRSARDYYASLAYGHDAVYLHAGGSPQAYEFIKSRGVTALDCVNGPYEGTLFWRDQERRRSAGLEHSVLTSSETIQELLPTYQRVRLDHEEGFQVGWTFQEGPEAGGEAAEILTVPFSTYKTGVFEYDPDSGLYLVEEYGEPYVDGNTGEQVAVKNVLVLYTDVSQLSGDSAGRLKVRTTGSGGGLLVRDGLAWPITWEREGESDRLSFYREDGQPAALGVGHSYINIVKTGTEVTWAAKARRRPDEQRFYLKKCGWECYTER